MLAQLVTLVTMVVAMTVFGNMEDLPELVKALEIYVEQFYLWSNERFSFCPTVNPPAGGQSKAIVT